MDEADFDTASRQPIGVFINDFVSADGRIARTWKQKHNAHIS
jgi:hypothetical protein